MNYFEFYDLPIKFHIDDKALKTKYFNLLKTNHPDFYINDPEKYQEALLHSSLNNEAYKCLSNFSSRVNYVLSLKYLDFEDKLPSSFLMEMMEINETLEDLTNSPNPNKIIDLGNEINALELNLQKNLLEDTLKADTSSIDDETILKQIKIDLLKQKYILRLKETLANIAAR